MNWIYVFVQFHAPIYGALLVAVGISLVPAMRVKKTRMSALAFVALNGVFCAYLLSGRDLASVAPNIFSYVWSMVALFPLVWLAAIDLEGVDSKTVWPEADGWEPLDLGTSILAGLAVAMIFAAVSFLSQAAGASRSLSFDSLTALGMSLLFHIAVFSAFGAGFYALWWICRRGPAPRIAYTFWAALMFCFICAQVLRSIVLPAISLEGRQANVFAAVFSASLVFFSLSTIATARSMARKMSTGYGSGLPRTARRVLVALVVCLAAYAVPAFLAARDWDFVLQKISVMLLWAFSMVGFCWADLRWRIKGRAVAAVVIVALVACDVSVLELATSSDENKWSNILEIYAGSNISFRTAYNLATRSVASGNYDGFYDFLKSRTNIREPARPVDLSLVLNLQPSQGAKPNIFIFVIDSLRRDYLSPYNSSIVTTPEFEKFARSSVVMENAFTRYAGTALSEPAIWVGAMQLHKQYIEPFSPMNNLQKLLETEGYRSYISLDPILQRVVANSSSITKLDSGLQVMSDYDYAIAKGGADSNTERNSSKSRKSWSTLDFVATLRELESELDARPNKHDPVFGYTQPQNVHTLTLEQSKSGKSRREISADEVQRMDGAFGQFIEFLKSRGMYDSSIVVVTSDHGDSYGEFGRFGHADFLFPEVIRIPLIIHLPTSLQNRLVYDARSVAFSMDITPSLYYLLGHRPTTNRELFGRPLFTDTPAEQEAYRRGQYLLASSYAPVYGILGGDGDTLFIVDAVNRKNYFYNLLTDQEGVHNQVTPRIRDEKETEIRRQLTMLDVLYGRAPR